jgi:uncharacterized membrane protein YphA (DoxX/SURF4 family)
MFRSCVIAKTLTSDQSQVIHFMKNMSIAGGFVQVIALSAGSFIPEPRLSRSKQGA